MASILTRHQRNNVVLRQRADRKNKPSPINNPISQASNHIPIGQRLVREGFLVDLVALVEADTLCAGVLGLVPAAVAGPVPDAFLGALGGGRTEAVLSLPFPPPLPEPVRRRRSIRILQEILRANDTAEQLLCLYLRSPSRRGSLFMVHDEPRCVFWLLLGHPDHQVPCVFVTVWGGMATLPLLENLAGLAGIL
jgi:hypothetical protein